MIEREDFGGVYSMNDKVIPDTNFFIYSDRRKLPENIEESILKKSKWRGVSVITILEYLSYPDIKLDEFYNYLRKNNFHILDLNHQDTDLITKIAEVRQEVKKVKLPDAIIIGTARAEGATLFSADKIVTRIKGKFSDFQFELFRPKAP